jgi:hypothetical protein
MKPSKGFQAFTCAMAAYCAFFAAIHPSLLQAQAAGATTQQAPKADLTIRVLEGEDGVNIIRTRTAVRPVVQVVDRNDLPVAGATVVFLLPGSGASATFASGARTMSVVTNSTGEAAAGNMTPVGTGSFNINVTASFQGQTATATITQTNFATVAAAQAAGVSTGAMAGGAGAGAGLSTGVIIGIIAGAAAAAAGIAAAKSGGNGGNGRPQGTISIGGTPTLGPPR